MNAHLQTKLLNNVQHLPLPMDLHRITPAQFKLRFHGSISALRAEIQGVQCSALQPALQSLLPPFSVSVAPSTGDIVYTHGSDVALAICRGPGNGIDVAHIERAYSEYCSNCKAVNPLPRNDNIRGTVQVIMGVGAL